jgi:hypothetical protein
MQHPDDYMQMQLCQQAGISVHACSEPASWLKNQIKQQQHTVS